MADQSFRTLDLMVPASEADNFKGVFQVEPQYLPQALSLAAQFQGAIDPTTLNFNFDRAMQIAQSIPQSSVATPLTHSVSGASVQVGAMVAQFQEVIRAKAGIQTSSPAFWNQVNRALAHVFTDLSTQQESPWISWRSATAISTSYYNNILLALHNEETGGVMAVLPIAFDINVSLVKQRVLFLTLQDSARYEVRMRGLAMTQELRKPQ
ncbi:hypothetical protein [Streptomyces sp. NPDC001205]